MTADEIANRFVELYVNNRSLPETIEEHDRVEKMLQENHSWYKPEKPFFTIIENPVRYTEEEEFKIIDELIEQYKLLSKEDRELVKAVIPEEVATYIAMSAVTAASICLNISDQRVFTNGLYLIGFNYERFDIRDTWIWLSTLVDVAMTHNLSYEEYFASGEPFVDELKKYLRRSDIKYILSAMQREIKTRSDSTKYYA